MTSQCLLVSIVFSMVSSLYIFILVSLVFYSCLALTVYRVACGEMILYPYTYVDLRPRYNIIHVHVRRRMCIVCVNCNRSYDGYV